MRLLLDTHMVIWAIGDSRRIPREGRRLIDNAEATFVSAASLFEIATKASIDKLKLTVQMSKLIQVLHASNLNPLPVTWTHAIRARDTAPGHADPFDRLLLAQAVTEPLHLLTADEALTPYSDLVLAV